jgi:hypothetical protein
MHMHLKRISIEKNPKQTRSDICEQKNSKEPEYVNSILD